MRKPKLLFAVEKWVDANPRLGLSSTHHNHLGSLAASGLAEFSCFFLDEEWARLGGPPDARLLDACAAQKPDLLFVKMARGLDFNPAAETLARIREQMNIPVAALYGDTFDEAAIRWIDANSRAVDVSIVMDCYSVYRRFSACPEKYLETWTPLDPALFHDSRAARDIAVCFVGAINRYPARKLALGLLEHAGLGVHHAGGEGSGFLAIEDYAGLLRRARIALNFSRPVFDLPNFQCKGRTLEATLSGALLMEEKNPETPRWFQAGEDYVEFADERELVEKTRHYLENETERAGIAAAGQAKAAALYSAGAYWRRVFARVLPDFPLEG